MIYKRETENIIILNFSRIKKLFICEKLIKEKKMSNDFFMISQ